jgi:hypothetical protein
MNFTLKINCDNAAFEENIPGEVARILKELAQQIEDGDNVPPWNLRDLNGNLVGKANLK